MKLGAMVETEPMKLIDIIKYYIKKEPFERLYVWDALGKYDYFHGTYNEFLEYGKFLELKGRYYTMAYVENDCLYVCV